MDIRGKRSTDFIGIGLEDQLILLSDMSVSKSILHFKQSHVLPQTGLQKSRPLCEDLLGYLSPP